MSAPAANLAKLSRPRLYDALPRERLFTLLDHERQRHPVVWISAQAGAGKTTLIASYLAARKIRGIWYQVDGGDADPATLFYYLGQAAKSLPGRAKAPLPLLTPEYLPNLAGFTRVYFRELFPRLGKTGVLVFDNFQEAPEDSAFHQVMVEALAEIPPGPTIILVSRVEPPPAYARFIANKQVAVVEWEQVRLTAQESYGVAQLQSRVDSKTVAKLHERSGGWAAGLTLLLERLRRGAALDEIGEPESLQDIFNYFAGQVLSNASPEDRHTLLHLAFLPRLTSGLAAQLSQSERAGKLLETLYRRHLFTHRRYASDPGAAEFDVGGSRYTYQFHALFREFLLHEARETYSPKKLAEISAGAAALLEDAGHKEEALTLHLANQDWVQASSLALRLAPEMLLQGRNEALTDYIRGLPGEITHTNAWLCYWFGIALAPNHWIEARTVLSDAYRLFERTHDTTGQMLAASGAVLTYFYDYDLFEPLDPWLDLLDQLLLQPSFPSASAELQVYTMVLLGMGHRRPEHPQQAARANRVLSLLKQERDLNLRAFAGYAMLWWVNQTRNWSLFDELQNAVGEAADDRNVVVINRASWLLQVPYFFHYCGKPLSSIPAFARCEALNQASGLQREIVTYWTNCGSAYDYLRTGALEKAKQCISAIDTRVVQDRLIQFSFIEIAKAALAMHEGRRDHALRHLSQAVDSIDRPGVIPYIRQIKLECHAFGLLELQCLEEAERYLRNECVALYGNLLPEALVCTMSFAWSYLALKRGRHGECRTRLSEALPLAATCRYSFIFAIYPNVLRELLEQALRGGIEKDYVKQLVRDFDCKPRSYEIESWPWPIKISVLGKFKVLCDDKPMRQSRKAPRRLLLLLKAIVAFGGDEVPEEQLTDALWPELEADAAHEAFSVAVRRLRALLGCPEAIRQHDGRLSLNRDYCWVDAFAFDRLVDEHHGDDERLRGMALYHGNLLQDEPAASWCHPLRDRLHRKFVHHIHAIAGRQEQEGEIGAAKSLYLRGLEADALAESFYQGLIRCLIHLGQRAEALSVYRRLRQTLSVTLGTSPSPQTEALYRELLEN